MWLHKILCKNIRKIIINLYTNSFVITCMLFICNFCFTPKYNEKFYTKCLSISINMVFKFAYFAINFLLVIIFKSTKWHIHTIICYLFYLILFLFKFKKSMNRWWSTRKYLKHSDTCFFFNNMQRFSVFTDYV